MKKLLLVFLSFTFVFSVSSVVFADIPEVIHDLGDYKIVGEKFRVAVPHEYNGPVYTYKNYGVTDSSGNIIVEPKYNRIQPPKEGRATFETQDGSIGFFDENWNIVIDAKYFTNGPEIYFSDGLAQVGKRDDAKYIVWGYIDKDGNEITDFIYDEAQPFENGQAWVGIEEYVYGGFNTNTKWSKIDKDGNLLSPFKFGYALERDYEYLWKEPVDVLLSENHVELNGVRYKNSELEYPFINYLGYSYIPLTYYGARALGINCDWTREGGVVLSSGGNPMGDITGDNGMSEGVYDKASFYKGKLTINGKLYEYGDTAYPLIHYKNVVYLPVCWQTGMDELGIDYDFVGPEKLENSDRGVMSFRR